MQFYSKLFLDKYILVKSITVNLLIVAGRLFF